MKKAKIYYFTFTDEQRKEEKLEWLRNTKLKKIPFELIQPSKKNNWINLADNDFEELMALIDKKEDNTLFGFSSLGVSTNRDEWVYDFDKENLENKMKFFIEKYNELLSKNDKKWNGIIKWSSSLKSLFKRKLSIKFDTNLILTGNYRPFTKEFYYAEKYLSDRLTQNHYDFFGKKLKEKNKLIGFSAGNRIDFCLYSTDLIPNLASFSLDPARWLPLYRYTSEGKRVDNITQWAVNEFRNHYSQTLRVSETLRVLEREDIFHYVYGVLHNPVYRKKYELNLKREFPRIPFYEDFWFWSEKGKELMELHLNYEEVEKYALEREEKPLKSGSLNKAKLKAKKEEGIIILDNLTTLKNVPALAWEYKLGNRSALEWILDQYKEKKPRDETIREKFNTYKFEDYKEEVIELLERVCTVSVKTMEIVGEMENRN